MFEFSSVLYGLLQMFIFLIDLIFPQYLDENKQLILAILENQNLGKLAECAQYVTI
jgi:ethanolamine ammonia-lyase large subunit